MVQLVKCLTCDYEDLSLDSKNPHRKAHDGTLLTANRKKEGDRWTPGSLWEKSWPTEFRPIKEL